MTSIPSEQQRERIGGALPRFSWKTSLAMLVILGVAGWSVRGTEFNPAALFANTQPVQNFISGMFPPEVATATLRTALQGVVETFQMSLLGAIIGAVVALPLAALGVRGIPTAGLSRRMQAVLSVPYHLSRLLTNVFRSVPEILWALIFVVALGLGPFPGTLALAVHSAGVLGKLYSENMESVPSRPVEALNSIGAGGVQSFLLGRLPQASAGFVSLSLYQWECNIRAATILGFVGAGGIGQEILISMNLFDYSEVTTLVLATVIMVLAVDRLSAIIRRRLVY